MPTSDRSETDLRALIRDVPDFPKPGILFRDVTPLLGNGPAFRACIRQLAARLAPTRPQAIAGIESRGFIFGAAVAAELGLGFVPIRKPGKLPWKTRKESYALEDSVGPGTRIALVDDLLATGGTAAAAIKLLQGLGAEVVTAAFVIELGLLKGRARLGEVPCEVLIAYA
jgi:adenine phosphoribosyltransferase